MHTIAHTKKKKKKKKKNETWTYWQLLVVDNEQIRVGGLNINSGGQLDGLICCLTWDKYTNEYTERFSMNFSISNIRKYMVIKADKTKLQNYKINFGIFLP